jgi:hypothetical protein
LVLAPHRPGAAGRCGVLPGDDCPGIQPGGCSGPLSWRGRLVVVVHVRLAGVLALEVLVRHVRVVQRRVVVLVLVRGAEVLKAPVISLWLCVT